MSETAAARPSPLLTAPVGSVLLRLTGPMVFGLTAIILFQVVDTFFVGMLGTNELAAMSFTFPVGFAVMSIAMGLGLATTAVIAHAIGQGDSTRVKRLTTHSLLLAVSVVSILGSVGIFTQELLFGRILGAPAHLLPLINDYMTVYFASVGFLVIPMVGNSAIRATGDTKTPSVIMAVAGLANALLDPLLIFGWGPIPGYGLFGAAIATAGSWVITFCWAIYVLHAREHMLEWVLPRWSVLVASWRTLLKIGLPAAASNLMIPLGQMALTRMVAGFGALSVAAFGVGTRIESLAMIGVFAMSTALNPVVAQNFGAGQLERVKQALFFAARYCVVLGAGTASLLYLVALPLAELFSDSSHVASSAGSYLEIVPWSYGALGIGVVVPTLLNALNRANQGALLTAVRLFVCILPCAYVGSQLNGFDGLLVGLAVGNGLVGLTAWLYAHRTVQRAVRDVFEPGLLDAKPSLPPAV